MKSLNNNPSCFAVNHEQSTKGLFREPLYSSALFLQSGQVLVLTILLRGFAWYIGFCLINIAPSHSGSKVIYRHIELLYFYGRQWHSKHLLPLCYFLKNWLFQRNKKLQVYCMAFYFLQKYEYSVRLIFLEYPI